MKKKSLSFRFPVWLHRFRPARASREIFYCDTAVPNSEEFLEWQILLSLDMDKKLLTSYSILDKDGNESFRIRNTRMEKVK